MSFRIDTKVSPISSIKIMGNSIIECLFVCFSVGGMRLDIEKGKPKFTLKDWNGVEISVCTLLLLIYLDDDDDRRKEGRNCAGTHMHTRVLCACH